MSFVKAEKHQAKIRMGLIGPAGSGKTYTALRVASALGGRIALIDTENASSAHYADEFNFDVCVLKSFSPETYTATIHEAEKAGYDILIIDSLSHAWAGKDGALQMVDNAAKRSQSGNTFAAWREVTPKHNEMVDAMIQCKCHLIVTLRAKMEYVQERDERTGKTTIRKVGLQPVQRDGLEYEFDVVGDVTIDHDLIISKTRCKALTDKMFSKPGEDIAIVLHTWLSAGAPAPEQPKQQFQPAQPQPQPPSNGDNGKRPLTDLELRSAYNKMVLEARAIGVPVAAIQVLSAQASRDDIIKAGKALRAHMQEAFREQQEAAAKRNAAKGGKS